MPMCLGYCISLSRCQWKLELRNLGDEHVDMMKQAIASWGCGKGRIITVDFSYGRLTSDGVGHLLSLPHNTLSDLSKLDLRYNELDSKSCEVLAHCLSSLPHLERLYLWAIKLAVMVHTYCHNLFTPTLHSES